MAKPKIALYWCSSCGGCEESVIDMAEDLLTIRERVDFVFWPVAIDTKYADVKEMIDGDIDVCLINGSVRMSEQEDMANLLRKKSKIIIAHGACAYIGGFYGLAQFFTKEECLDRAYTQVPSVNNPRRSLPEVYSKDGAFEFELSEFFDEVKPLNQVIDVDYYIPGCPPNPVFISKALLSILDEAPLPKGHVFADQKALCHTCSRKDSKPERVQLSGFMRIHEGEWDSEKCFLAQDMICFGPSTRGGCDERCIKANMPCRGCYGPPEHVADHGSKLLSALTSILNTKDENELKTVADSLLDMGGVFYRYSLPSSLLGKKLR
jgi:F420-non-reducing hydrogenase small subunit